MAEYCNNCDKWVTGYTLERLDFFADELVTVCGFCGEMVKTYDEEAPDFREMNNHEYE